MALAQQKWAESAQYYQKAIQLAPAFSFAGANRTLALYAGGQTNEAMREMRSVARQCLMHFHHICFQAVSWCSLNVPINLVALPSCFPQDCQCHLGPIECKSS